MPDSKTSPEQFPLQGLTNDGWSNEEEASATCACGAVQMVIVRTVPVDHIDPPEENILCIGGYQLTHLAIKGTRTGQHFCLPLFRLSKSLGLDVRYQLYRPGYPHPIHKGRRQLDSIFAKQNHHHRRNHGQFILQDMRYTHVSSRDRRARNQVYERWDYR